MHAVEKFARMHNAKIPKTICSRLQSDSLFPRFLVILIDFVVFFVIVMAISGISSVNGRICIPGELLYSAEDGNFVAGNGAYSIHGRIHSSLSGVVRTSVKKNQVTFILNIYLMFICLSTIYKCLLLER